MWRDEALLLDMLLAAEKAVEFLGDRSLTEFQADEVLQHAVMRLLTVLGEAARAVSKEYKEQHPGIQWAGIVGLRNRLVHEYFTIDVERVYEVVRSDVPSLIVQLRALVPPDDTASA